METKDEYMKNVELLKKWAKAYYIYDAPIATDEEYDLLYRDVLKYEEANPADMLDDSPTQVVGAPWGE